MKLTDASSLLLFSLFVLAVSFLPWFDTAYALAHQRALKREPDKRPRALQRSLSNHASTQESSFSNAESTEPWTHPPICTDHIPELDSPLCVYTLASFNNNTGLSLFTTPSHAQSFQSLPIIRSPQPLPSQNAPYHLTALPCKGTSLIATQPLPRLTPLLTTHPILIMHPSPTLTTSTREHYLRLALTQLPPTTQSSFSNLSKIYHQPAIAAQDVVKANAFELPLPHPSSPHPHMHLAVFPAAARINHDCAPNAMYFVDADRLTHHVSATRDIAAGEEVSVAYLNVLQGREARARMTGAGWGFECRCERCEREKEMEEDGNDGDDVEEIGGMERKLKGVLKELWRRSRVVYADRGESVQQLERLKDEDEAETEHQVPSPEGVEQLLHDFLGFFRSHGLEGFMEQAYRLAAMVAFVSGEHEKARAYANSAAEVMEMRDGPKHGGVRLWGELGKASQETSKFEETIERYVASLDG